MVELRNITFENVYQVLKLEPGERQKNFVENVSTTIALAYAGINEKCPGELCVIYDKNQPVGVILIGRSQVGGQEPLTIRQYTYAYRFLGFFVDYKYQHKGIGRKAFQQVLDKVEAYPDGRTLPMTLEVKMQNTNAIRLYEMFGFYDSVVKYDDDCVYVRLPQTE